MLVTLDPTIWTADPKDKPDTLTVLPEDVAYAVEVRNHFKRFLFGAIEGTNDFQTNINAILSNETIQTKEFGYVACLPSVYVRDKAHVQVKRAARYAEEGYLAEIGSQLTDLDCEILESVKSKNFDGYNISAIINSKMASWLNKTDLKIGPCVIVKAKVKDHSKHWKHQNDVTRLNYVKAVQ
jgi:hypothetical protein